MNGQKKHDYINKCGSCQFFAFRVRYGDTRNDGHCFNPLRKNYHQASAKACKLYKQENEDG